MRTAAEKGTGVRSTVGDTSADMLDVKIVQRTGFFRTSQTSIAGRFTFYEDTHDGSDAGFFKFSKDVSEAMGFSKDDVELEASSDQKIWVSIKSSASLDHMLQNVKSSKVLYVKLTPRGGFPWLAMGTAVAVLGIATVVGMKYVK